MRGQSGSRRWSRLRQAGFRAVEWDILYWGPGAKRFETLERTAPGTPDFFRRNHEEQGLQGGYDADGSDGRVLKRKL